MRIKQKRINVKKPMNKVPNFKVNINGEVVDLGKLCEITPSQCSVTNNMSFSIKCLKTGKRFNNAELFAEHMAKILKEQEV